MTTAAIITAICQYGPSVVPLLQQAIAWAEGGKTTVTSADLDLLVKLGQKPAADYLTAAGGPPAVPPASPVTPKAP